MDRLGHSDLFRLFHRNWSPPCPGFVQQIPPQLYQRRHHHLFCQHWNLFICRLHHLLHSRAHGLHSGEDVCHIANCSKTPIKRLFGKTQSRKKEYLFGVKPFIFTNSISKHLTRQYITHRKFCLSLSCFDFA